MRIEKHDFLDHLESRGAGMACPFCSASAWEMLIEEPVELTDQRAMEFAITRWPSGMSIPLLVFTCAGCGFVRLQSAAKAIAQGCPTR